MTTVDEAAGAIDIESPCPPLAGPVLSNMLLGEDEFIEPPQMLRDLKADQSTLKIVGAPETIAQILAHMHFWQHRNLAVISGEKPLYPKDPDQTWSEVRADQWPGLVAEFLSDLDELMALTENDAGLTRDLGEDETVGDRIRWTAIHNAYHFGQIALLRRMQGIWPPEGE
jgi:uncharacterized damage-inducible protein DinB